MIQLNTQTIISTVEIAEIGLKSHSEVLHDLKEAQNSISSKDYRSLWNISRYTDSLGRNCIMYKVTKKGWLLLLKNYDSNIKLKMIDKCLQEDQLLKDRLIIQQTLAERVWDKIDHNDLYRRL